MAFKDALFSFLASFSMEARASITNTLLSQKRLFVNKINGIFLFVKGNYGQLRMEYHPFADTLVKNSFPPASIRDK